MSESSNFKRHRASSSQGSSVSSTSTVEAQHPSKVSRTVPGLAASSPPLLCTLPPTCNHRPTPLANSRELETHYATYHAHVCEQGGCGAVFPEARLLELVRIRDKISHPFASLISSLVSFLFKHQTECHDPLAAVRKDRGEKIAHGYPKEYFFSVTNKGVGGLLKKWGEGASMIRGEWKARGAKSDDDDLDDEDNDNDDIDDHAADYNDDTGLHVSHKGHNGKAAGGQSSADDALDGLADTMGSLSLVPPAIRFGRGGKKGGFLHSSERGGFDATGGYNNGYRGRGRGGRGRGRGVTHPASAGMDVDPPLAPAAQLPLGHAGRGRAGIIHRPRGRGGFRGGRLNAS
ncbi:hypothetical protein C0991_001696 [Blastosporella zonata]|nr:hypothetical protein C0991_001696 [Blastosporella zonata]